MGAHAAAPPGYRLAWSDDFDGAALDTAKWQYRTGVRYWSTQQPENVSVGGGLLHLHLRKEPVDSTDYTAGGVISQPLFRYGYYEARMKVPPGRGWHTSFWMMRNNRPATATEAIELDVIENDSISPTTYGVNTHRHVPTPHVTYGNRFLTTPSLSEDFHVFGCEFTPTVIRYLFDGNVVQTVNATQFAHDDLNIWLTSVAAPLGNTPSVDETLLPAEAQYDWVRYYEPFAVPVVRITSPTAPAVTMEGSGQSLHLSAVVATAIGTSMVEWSVSGGAGPVTFSDPSSTVTTVSFGSPGCYVVQCTAANEGGSSSDRVCVGIGEPAIMTLREGVDDYSHTATLLRGDNPSWNAGARDQLLVGRNTAPFRSVFSFPLVGLSDDAVIHEASLDLTSVGGTGTVGTLGVYHLSATPVEGAGTADGSSGADLGIGTGATWITRTGGTSPSDLWAVPGGDFDATALSEVPGFSAAISGQTIRFPNTPALLTAVRNARDGNAPLDLLVRSANETTSTAYVRIASDDEPLEHLRPALRIQFTGNRMPVVSAEDLTAEAHVEVPLAATLAGAGTFVASCISGPADPTISDPESPSPTITFPKPGIYVLRLRATNTYGCTSKDIAVTAVANPSYYNDWLATNWPSGGAVDSGPTDDPDGDGTANLLEWALLMDPLVPDVFRPEIRLEPPWLLYRITRRRIETGEATVAVEWADNPAGPWTTEGIVADPASASGSHGESVLYRIPQGHVGHRFVRLHINKPNNE
ncbi:MAG: glycoside hydrolase family 16 protein [Verrucomicrobia bacterium]|nr:glycoside hydrolase family 16 protein [Verrucomicrobiota bacterium]